YRGLVVKLDGQLSGIERQGTRVVCGGGARLPSAAAQAARWGLSGLEFGINIPGTVGGAVKMNANAYGGELGRVLEWVNVWTAGQLLEAAGCRELRIGGARFSEKHANFVENAGGATTADILALMAEGRRRVHARFGISLEPEVQVLGEIEWPDTWDLPG